MKLSAASTSATAPIAGVAMTAAGTASAAAPRPALLSIWRRSMIISRRSSASMPFGSGAPSSSDSTEPSFARRHDEDEGERNTFALGSPAIRLSYDERRSNWLSNRRLVARVLEDDLRDDAVAVVHEGERILEAARREPVRDDGIEIDDATLEEAHHARPRGGGIRAASDDVHVAEHDPVGWEFERLALAGDPEEDDAPAGTDELRRELDRIHGAGSLDHEVE